MTLKGTKSRRLFVAVLFAWILAFRYVLFLSDKQDQLLAIGPSNLHATPTIGKVTVSANKLNNSVIRRALRTHQHQNDIHGYPHHIATKESVGRLIENDSKGRPRGAWTKPAYLLSVMVAELQKPEHKRLKWLYWFDADTVVLNPQTPLEIFLPTQDQLSSIHLLIGSNWDGLNSGAFAIRVHPWSVSLLSAVLAYPIYNAAKLTTDRFRDQSAFQWLLQGRKSPLKLLDTADELHWAEVPMRWFNSLPVNNAFDKTDGKWLFGQNMTEGLFDNGTFDVYDDGHGGQVQPWKVMQGDMVVHFAGSTAGGTRDSWMEPWLDRAERLLPEWNNKSTQTDIKAATAEFWARLMAARVVH